MIKFLDLNKQYLSIKDEIDKAIQMVINDSAFIGGKHVNAFEDEFADYQKAEHCIGCGNGTDALEIAMEALGLTEGSEVIVPANTFIASAEAVTRCGHKVVFCDCDPANYTISIDDARDRITERTSAIIGVHLYGHPCDMDGLNELAKESDLKVIEDCAQAHGAEYKGRRVGAIGDIGTFSFYPGKNLGAYGDAGAIVTNNKELALKCRMIANHGRIDKYDHEFEGRNSRLDGLQAAVLSVKLKHLDKWIQARIDVAEYYMANLSNVESLVLPKLESWARHVFHLFVIRSKQRDELKKYLTSHKISTGIHYPVSLPQTQAYGYLAQDSIEMKADKYAGELLSLPIGEHLYTKDLEYITRKLLTFFRT